MKTEEKPTMYPNGLGQRITQDEGDGYAKLAEPDQEPSILIDWTNEQAYASEDLDYALAELARKVRPIKVDVPQKDEADSRENLTSNSEVIVRLINNAAYTRRQAQLIRALTKSLQV